MALFVGGPYHGRDLPIETMPKMLRLPSENELGVYLGTAKADPGVTGKHDWPFLYHLDDSLDRPFYRYVRSE